MNKLSGAYRYIRFNMIGIYRDISRQNMLSVDLAGPVQTGIGRERLLTLQSNMASFGPLSGDKKKSKGSSYKFTTPPGAKSLRKGAIAVSIVTLLALVVIVVGLVRYFGAVPPPEALMNSLSVSFPGKPNLKLPSGDEVTVSLKNLGIVESVGGDSQISIASVTKMMSAYIILKDHPLSVGEQGPSITVTAADVNAYRQELAQNDSVVAVRQGEKITELEALEAALIPSGDNIVQMLAAWDAGSIKAFVAKMNTETHVLGLTHTHYAGPSGVNPATVSTAYDQTKLADILMKNHIFAQIVAMPQVTLPDVGIVYNVNGDLGRAGIVGVKTGWVPAGGASFVFATDLRLPSSISSQIGSLQAVSTIMGQQGASPIPTVLSDALNVSQQLSSLVVQDQLVPDSKEVGILQAPYSNSVQLVTTKPIDMIGFPGAKCKVSLLVNKKLIKAPLANATEVGELSLTLGSETRQVPVVTKGTLSAPSFGYRVLR